MRKLEVEKSRVRKAINMVRKNIEKKREQTTKLESREQKENRKKDRKKRAKKYWIDLKMRRVSL
jgi:hypothetical protein